MILYLLYRFFIIITTSFLSVEWLSQTFKGISLIPYANCNPTFYIGLTLVLTWAIFHSIILSTIK